MPVLSRLSQTCPRAAVLRPQPGPRPRISRCRGRIQRGAARAPPRPSLTAAALPLVGPAGRAGQPGAVEVAVGAAVGGALERDGEGAGGGQSHEQSHEQSQEQRQEQSQEHSQEQRHEQRGPAAPRRHGHRSPRPRAHWPEPRGTASAAGQAPQHAKRPRGGGTSPS